mmetsp:Transcript_42452/g.95851  ORF Transcript_42452/g.95851 Transcript_42452/m.95851 type:complete len:235 (+) Transcript_42452:47-751(+)
MRAAMRAGALLAAVATALRGGRRPEPAHASRQWRVQCVRGARQGISAQPAGPRWKPSAAAWLTTAGSSGGAVAAGAIPQGGDAERIFFYQPLVAVLLIFLVLGYVFYKTRRLQDARDERLLCEVELRKLQAALLSGGSREADIEALEEQVKLLRAKEEAESELVGFGEDSPTSKRYSLIIRPPPSDVSRAYKSLEAQRRRQTAKPSSTEESNTEIAAVLVVMTVYTWFLWNISG